MHLDADSPDRSSSSLLSHARADVAVAEPSSQASLAPRFNSSSNASSYTYSALLTGAQPSIHSIRPIAIPHISAQREVAHIAGRDLEAGGALNQHLIVAASDGWRFFSHGTRWHPWGYCGVCEHQGWGLEVPPRTPDEVASGQEEDEAEKVVMTACQCVDSGGSSGRVLVISGNSHGWIHVWDMTGIQKPQYWQEQMLDSGFDAVSGRVLLADVTSQVSILMRWQAYSDAPVGGLKLLKQLAGVPLALLVSHPGAESTSRTAERLRFQSRRKYQSKRELDLGFPPLVEKARAAAVSVLQGGAAVWRLDGSMVGTLASIPASDMGSAASLPCDGWNAQEVLSQFYGKEVAENATAAVQAGVGKEAKAAIKADKISRLQATEATLRIVNTGMQALQEYERQEFLENHRRKLSLEEKEEEEEEVDLLSSRKEDDRTSSGPLTLGRSKGVKKEQSRTPTRTLSGSRGAGEKEKQEFTQRRENFFVIDTTRKKLKKIDDEMEGLRFFSRVPAATAQAMEALSSQRAAVVRDPEAEAPVTNVKTSGVLGIAALGSLGSGLMSHELRMVVQTAQSSSSGAGRALPRGLGGARSRSAVPGHRSVGVYGTRRSFTPAVDPSPPVGEGNCGAVSMQLAPLLSQCRHAKRWEAEPFRNLITFQLDDVADGGGKNGSKRRVGTNFVKKERREEGVTEEASPEAQFHGRNLPSYTKCKLKGVSAQRLKQTLHLDPLS